MPGHADTTHATAPNTSATIAEIATVVARFTALKLPAKPSALAIFLLLEHGYDGADSMIARACAEHVLAHVGRHLPANRAADVAEVDVDELAAALCVLP